MILALLFACGTPEAATPVADCSSVPDVSWDAWGEGFFRTYCTSCHGSGTRNRNGAPPGYDFDDQSVVLAHAEDIRRAVLTDQTMPVGGGVYPDDLTLLDVYLSCHAAASP
jgi:hypothetical protein